MCADTPDENRIERNIETNLPSIRWNCRYQDNHKIRNSNSMEISKPNFVHPMGAYALTLPNVQPFTKRWKSKRFTDRNELNIKANIQ